MKRVLAISAILFLVATFLLAMQDQAKSLQQQCFANYKQAIKSFIMYANDNDDYVVLADAVGIGSPQWGTVGEDDTYRSPWSLLLVPYSRSMDQHFCPADENTRDRKKLELDPRTDKPLAEDSSAHLRASAMLYRTNLGYNHVWLAPEAMIGGNRQFMPVTQSDVAVPSMTLVFVDSAWARDADGKAKGGGRYLVDAPVRPHTGVFWGTLPSSKDTAGGWLCYVRGQADPKSPYCKSHPQAFGYCYPFHPGETYTACFIDGHAKAVTRTALLAGVSAAEQRITDHDACLWDTR